MRLISLLFMGAFIASSRAKIQIIEFRDTTSSILVTRQDPEGLACTSNCQVLTTAGACNFTASCVCNTATAQDLQSCVSCLVGIEPTLPASNQTELTNDLTEIVTGFNEECTPLGIPTLALSSGTPTSTGLGSESSFNTVAAPTLASTLAPTFAPAPVAPDAGLGGGPSATITNIPAQSGLGGNSGAGSIGNSGGSSNSIGGNNTPGGQGGPQGGNQNAGGVAKVSLSLSVLGLGLAASMILMSL